MYMHPQPSTQPARAAPSPTAPVVLPITATIGIPVEILGMISCEFMGICHLWRRSWREEEEDHDEQPKRRRPAPVEHDTDDDQEAEPGESARYKMADWLLYTSGCRTAGGLLRWDGQSAALQLVFSRALMRPCTREQVFEQPCFLVPQAYELPDTLCADMGLPLGVQIKAGNYPIHKQADTYTIVTSIGQ